MDSSPNENTNSPPSKRRKLTDSTASDDVIDEYFSQQLDTLGHDAVRSLLRSDVLLSGLGGLGVEVAKNVILSGAKSLTLHDLSVCTVFDLSSQYYLTRADLGRNRAEACCDRLAELNPRVPTTTYLGDLTEEFVKSFSVVILTDSDLEEQLRVDSVTHANNIPLIIASTKGLFGQVFCDFGDNFEVSDTNGEVCSTGYVSSVTKDVEGIVTCFQNTKVNLADGDFVTFCKIEGMKELNGCPPKQIRVINPFQFSIGDTSNYSDYIGGGIVKQVKIPRVINFKQLSLSIEAPQFVVTDSAKPDQPRRLHMAFQTLHEFRQAYGRYPRPWNNEDSENFVNMVLSASKEPDNDGSMTNIEVFKLFSKVCSGSVCPINSIIGGIVAQEVAKACSGKLTPINQWLYFDAVECLPSSINVDEEDCQAIDNRYDGQVAVFGREFQNKLGSLNYFVVGAGAIGCELLKNLSMMGVGDINRGRVLVADHELVRRSDLNSQFLYRPKDIQCLKSITATSAIHSMNLNTNIISNQREVCHEADQTFDDEFFENIDGVIVQGNVTTRKFVDLKCVYHHKPLIDCGIEGTKGSCQVVVPLLTQSYQCSQDSAEINFFERSQAQPSKTEDVLYWARNNFEVLFNQSAENAQKYLVNDIFREVDFNKEQIIELLESVKSMLVDNNPNNIEDCIFWARKIWQTQYVDDIRKLLMEFPPDATTDSGEPFWSRPKRCPVVLSFSIDDPLHLDYIRATANLIAKMFDITQNQDREYIRERILNSIDPKFLQYQKCNNRPSTLSSNRRVSSRDRLSHVLFDLPSKEQLGDFKITPIEFDPYDDSNFHMDFIIAAANLRAANFGVEPADRRTGKVIAGNITPTIPTTSSVVAGLAALELIKLAQRVHDIDVSHFKNGFINLALPFIDFAEPLPPTQHVYNNTSWTVWDRFDVQGELSLDQFLHYFQTRDLRIMMIHHGSCVLYSELFPMRRLQEIRKLTMTQVLRKLSGMELSPTTRTLMFNLVCVDLTGNDVEVPRVRYVLPLSTDQT